MTSTVFFSRYSLVALAILALFTGCNDQPSSIGTEFITDTLSTVVVKSDETRLFDSSYSGRITVALTNGGDKSNVSSFLVGQTADTKAMSFLRFSTVPDSVANLKESEIISASLKMYPLGYAYGDTNTNSLAFRVVRIKSIWGSEATTDTLTNGDFLGEQFASYSGKIDFGDSIPAVSVPFSSVSETYRWLFTDSAKYGLALVPEAASSLIRQFSTIGVGETDRNTTSIELIYKRTDSTHTDTVLVSSAFINTFVESRIPLPDNRMTIQGGIVQRTSLILDVSMIPALAVIHRAELVLTRDPALSKVGVLDDEPKLLARFAVDSALTSSDGSYAVGTKKSGSEEYVFPNIAPAVERWLRTGTNYGLILHNEVGHELAEVNRLSFYGLNDPDPTKRPRLTIVYSIPARMK